MLDKSTVLIGVEHIDKIMTQGSTVLNARLEAFVRFEERLIGQVHDHVTSVTQHATSQYRGHVYLLCIVPIFTLRPSSR